MRILSIKELESMISAIKKDNPYYKKRVEKSACGIFSFDNTLVKHRHIGNQSFETIKYGKGAFDAKY